MKKILLTAICAALVTPAYAEFEFINGLYVGTFETSTCDAPPKYIYYKNQSYTYYIEIGLNIRGTTTSGDTYAGESIRSVSPLKMTVESGYIDIDSETFGFSKVVTEIINPNAVATVAVYGGDLRIKLEDNDCEHAKNFAYDINIRPQTDYQTVAGTVKNSARTAVPNARVTFYKTNGAYVNSVYTGANGIYSASIPRGGYVVEFASYDGKTGIYNGGVPIDKASRIVVGDKKVTANATLDATAPTVTAVATATVAGKPGYTITGYGFGTSRGYVDLGGYATNSSSYIKGWTNTQIELVRSSTMPSWSNCLRVFGKTTGYSDCIAY